MKQVNSPFDHTDLMDAYRLDGSCNSGVTFGSKHNAPSYTRLVVVLYCKKIMFLEIKPPFHKLTVKIRSNSNDWFYFFLLKYLARFRFVGFVALRRIGFEP